MNQTVMLKMPPQPKDLLKAGEQEQTVLRKLSVYNEYTKREGPASLTSILLDKFKGHIDNLPEPGRGAPEGEEYDGRNWKPVAGANSLFPRYDKHGKGPSAGSFWGDYVEQSPIGITNAQAKEALKTDPTYKNPQDRAAREQQLNDELKNWKKSVNRCVGIIKRMEEINAVKGTKAVLVTNYKGEFTGKVKVSNKEDVEQFELFSLPEILAFSIKGVSEYKDVIHALKNPTRTDSSAEKARREIDSKLAQVARDVLGANARPEQLKEFLEEKQQVEAENLPMTEKQEEEVGQSVRAFVAEECRKAKNNLLGGDASKPIQRQKVYSVFEELIKTVEDPQ